MTATICQQFEPFGCPLFGWTFHTACAHFDPLSNLLTYFGQHLWLLASWCILSSKSMQYNQVQQQRILQPHIHFILTWSDSEIWKMFDYFVDRKSCSLSFPRRVFVPWLGGTYVCDYIQPSETLEVCIYTIKLIKSSVWLLLDLSL